MFGEIIWTDEEEESKATVFLDGEAVELPSALIVPLVKQFKGFFMLRLRLSTADLQDFSLVSDSLEKLKLTANLWLMIDSQHVLSGPIEGGEEGDEKLFRDIEDYLGLKPNQNTEGETDG